MNGEGKNLANPDFLVAGQHPRDQTIVLRKAAGIGRDQIVEGSVFRD
jgi:hypothetical protein